MLCSASEVNSRLVICAQLGMEMFGAYCLEGFGEWINSEEYLLQGFE